MRILQPIFITLMILVLGCSSPDSAKDNYLVSSDSVKSSALYADIEIIAKGNGTTFVQASLNARDNDGKYVKFVGTDKMSATAKSTTQLLTKGEGFLNWWTYGAIFNHDEPTEFVVALEREKDNSAPSSKVILPEKFTIDSPKTNEIFQRGEQLTVKWSPYGKTEKMDISISVDCDPTEGLINSILQSMPANDTGSKTFSITELLRSFNQGINNSSNCSGKVEVSRYRVGTLDSNYGEGGSIKAKQVRSREFIIQP